MAIMFSKNSRKSHNHRARPTHNTTVESMSTSITGLEREVHVTLCVDLDSG